MTITISLEPSDAEIIRDLLGVEAPVLGQTVTLPGDAKLVNLTAGSTGLTAMEAARFLLENVDAVAANLLAAYIFEKLHRKRVTLRIADEAVPIEKAAIASKIASLQTTTDPNYKTPS